MPLQRGLYRIKGKHNGLSYYSVKGGQGDTFRKINEQMSERVKTEPAFRNTRAYAEEFRAVTSTASTFLSLAISRRHFYAFRAFKTTLATPLRKALFSAMRNQSTPTIGKRDFPNNGWQTSVCDLINRFSRVDVSDIGGMVLQATMSPSSGSTRLNASLTLRLQFNQRLLIPYLGEGFDKVRIFIDWVSIKTPIYDESTEKHSDIQKLVTPVYESSYDIGDDYDPITITRGAFLPYVGAEDGKYVNRLIISCLPYKSDYPDAFYFNRGGAYIVPIDFINN